MAMDSTLQLTRRAKPTSLSGRVAISSIADIWVLTKPEINFLIAITVVASYLVARRDSGWHSILLALHAMVGTVLVSSGAATLNQFIERRFDSCMRRTRRRPLVKGTVSPRTALVFGFTVFIVGLVYLGLWVNLISSFIAGAAFLIYLFAYTPLKRASLLCTLVGAIAGAAPPLLGWAGAVGTLNRGAWTLYALLFLWQFPHFMAIAWMYRDDYERAGYRILPEHTGRRLFTALQAGIPAVLLIPVSLLPYLSGGEGDAYFVGAIFIGFGFAGAAFQFGLKPSNQIARRLLFASIVYLPSILFLLVMDKR